MVRKKKRGIDHKWVKNNNDSISIIFSYQKKRYQFAPVQGGDFTNDQDRAIATQIARQIELDIKLGKFVGLDPWLPKQLQSEAEDLTTIGDIWSGYMTAKRDKVSKASQVSVWRQTDTCLRMIDKKNKVLGHYLVKSFTPPAVIKLLLNDYAHSVVARVLSDLHAACNLALKRELITSNPLSGYQDYLPKPVKSPRSKACYSQTEVQIILETFKDNHYEYFVKFLFLTGVRPQLAIALTWGDIKKDKIIFNKGFTNGEHTPGKTGRETHFPIYPQLGELILQVFQANQNNIFSLLFPSEKKDYINLRSFTKNVWRPAITKLVESGKLSKYLPTYHCRHSTATFLAKAGIPSSTIAALLDTSERMLSKHYLDSQELTNVAIPDFLGSRMDVTGLEPVTPTMSRRGQN